MKTSLQKLLSYCLLVVLFTPARLLAAETGVPVWTQFYMGPANGGSSPRSLLVDSSNNIVVTGRSYGDGTALDYATVKYSSAGVGLWTNRFNGTGNGYDFAVRAALDSSNNVFVTGYANGGASLYDCVTIKYSTDGVPLWTNVYNGLGNSWDVPAALAVDSSNNVIVTGSTIGSTGYTNYLTIKYSSTGIALWTNIYNGKSFDRADAVVVDKNDDVIVTGQSTGNTNDWEFATIKYSGDGVPLWTNRYNGLGRGWDIPAAMAVDSSNNLIVAGYSIGAPGYVWDYATVKYSSGGMPLWTNRYDDPAGGEDVVTGMVVDNNDSVIVTGYSASTKAYPYHTDYLTIKYSNAGVPVWTNRFHGSTTNSDQATAVAVDSAGNAYVTGSSYGMSGGSDMTTIKYSSAGVPVWTNRYRPTAGDCYGSQAAVDRDNNLIVAGSAGGPSFLTVKFVTARLPVFTNFVQANGTFQMQVDDVLPSGTLVIEASINLTGWAPIFTNTAPTNMQFYADPATSNYSRRFYRAFQFP